MDSRPGTCFTALLLAATMLVATSAYATDAAMAQPEPAGADAGLAQAQAPAATLEAKLTQKVDSTKPIYAGQTVTITYEIERPADATVSFPETYEPERWVLIDASEQPVPDGERSTKSIWIAKFGIYRPGTTTLKPFAINVTNAAGAQVVLQTEPVEVKVLSLFADATEEPAFEDPRPPVAVWVDDYTLAYLGGGALALSLIGLGLWWMRRRQLMMPPPPPPPRSPHEIALEKLGALAGDDLVERGEYMLYWVRLSEAIREYLGRTYGFPGTELTTTEMLGELDPVVWPAGIGIEDVNKFLRRCDEVKFGGANPNVEESTESLRRGFSIVELTRPRLAAEPAPEQLENTLSESTEVDEEPNDTVQDDPNDVRRWAPPALTDLHEEEE